MAGATLAGVECRSEVIGPLTSHQGILRARGEIPESSPIASSLDVRTREPTPTGAVLIVS
jgi:hypothetical protein